jgi:DnaJ-class molecular chaperone
VAKSLYQILGLEKTASDEEIRKAYRTLAKKLHPDLNPGDKAAEERFKEVAGAFAILGDAEKRKRYDRGEIDESGAERPEQRFYRHYADSDRRHQYTSTAGFEDFVDFGDLFREAFARAEGGERRSHAGSTRFPGADVRYHLSIDFLEAAKGAKKRITMPEKTTLDVSIPAGIEDGKILRLKGKGQPGLNGGPPGDALVSIQVRQHRIFKRDGDNILIDLPIGLHEAVLGGKVKVPTITGRVTMTVPKGATSGQTLRLRGKGIQSRRGAGDQLVRLTIAMPDDVDAELENFMKSWAATHDYDPRADLEKASSW